MSRAYPTFRSRRLKWLLITVVACAVFVFLLSKQVQNLQHASFTSGYVLLGSLFFLAAFNWRKKIPFLPVLGSASFWMQAHIYVGWSTFLVFACHIGWQIPNGQFETFLAVLYLGVALSGVYGLYITRVLPARLTNVAEEVIFERIPAFRQQLAAQVRAAVLSNTNDSQVVARFYASRLAPFFERPRSWMYLIYPTGRRRRQLIDEINGLNRFLVEDQRHISGTLARYVETRDDLDFHTAIQGRLKLWLFVHIGLTYSLLIIAVMHGIMAHAFAGGLR